MLLLPLVSPFQLLEHFFCLLILLIICANIFFKADQVLKYLPGTLFFARTISFNKFHHCVELVALFSILIARGERFKAGFCLLGFSTFLINKTCVPCLCRV